MLRPGATSWSGKAPNAARIAPRPALARGAIRRSFVSMRRVVQVRLDRRLCAAQPAGDLRDRQVLLLAIVPGKRRGAPTLTNSIALTRSFTCYLRGLRFDRRSCCRCWHSGRPIGRAGQSLGARKGALASRCPRVRRHGLVSETAACDGLNGLAPGQIDSRAMTEAVADSDSFVSPDTAAATRPRVLFFAWLVGAAHAVEGAPRDADAYESRIAGSKRLAPVALNPVAVRPAMRSAPASRRPRSACYEKPRSPTSIAAASVRRARSPVARQDSP